MEKRINKLFIVAVLSVIMTTSFGLTSMFKENSNIVYLNSYQDECIILNNSQNQRVIIGRNNLIADYTNKNNINHYDVFLSFDNISGRTLTNLKSLNIDNFVAPKGDSAYDEIFVAPSNQIVKAGGFYLEFIEYSNKIMGLKVNFDNYTIFIASQTKVDYNSFYENLFLTIKPDVIFSGKNDYIGGDYYTISANKNEVSSLSFYQYGNMSINLGNEIKARRLD